MMKMKNRTALGRVEPQVAQNMRQRLGRRKIKSEFIQVIGENVQLPACRLPCLLKKVMAII